MKIKWLQFKSRSSFESLLQKFLDNQYTSKTNRGFLLNKADEKYIIGRHITRVLKKEVVEDPFGGYFEREFLVFETVDFEIISSRPNSLKLKNPPRKLKPFLQDFLEICGFRSVVSEITIDCLGLVDFLESKGLTCKVTEMDLESIPMSNQTSAAMTLKGSGDVRASVLDIFPGRNPKAKKLSMVVSISGEQCYLSLAATGLMVLNPRHDFPMAKLENFLYEALSYKLQDLS